MSSMYAFSNNLMFGLILLLKFQRVDPANCLRWELSNLRSFSNIDYEKMGQGNFNTEGSLLMAEVLLVLDFIVYSFP